MSATTRFLCRFAGIYTLTIALIMIAHRDGTVETVTALVHDAALTFIVGIFTFLGGLAWVLLHNRWTGGAQTVVITIIGWVVLLKGLLLLSIAPANAPDFYLGTLHYARLFYVYAAASSLLGLYLSYAGFRSVDA